MGRLWQTQFDVRGKAVGRHNVESRAREEHDTRRLCLLAQCDQRFEAGDLAADIHVVTFCPQAGFRHLTERMHEWARAMQHAIHLL